MMKDSPDDTGIRMDSSPDVGSEPIEMGVKQRNRNRYDYLSGSA